MEQIHCAHTRSSALNAVTSNVRPSERQADVFHHTSNSANVRWNSALAEAADDSGDREAAIVRMEISIGEAA